MCCNSYTNNFEHTHQAKTNTFLRTGQLSQFLVTLNCTNLRGLDTDCDLLLTSDKSGQVFDRMDAISKAMWKCSINSILKFLIETTAVSMASREIQVTFKTSDNQEKTAEESNSWLHFFFLLWKMQWGFKNQAFVKKSPNRCITPHFKNCLADLLILPVKLRNKVNLQICTRTNDFLNTPQYFTGFWCRFYNIANSN